MPEHSQRPSLATVARVRKPRAVVLFLHGGQEHNPEPVLRRHATWWRVALLATSVRSLAWRDRYELRLLRYAQRGWNGTRDPAPVRDARWALERIREERPGVPVVLVGHSMGGRTACWVADDPAVVGVVGLAPWLPPGTPTAPLADTPLRVLHGDADRVTSLAASQAFAARLRDARVTPLPEAGHYMFRRVRDWNRFVKDSVRTMVADRQGVT